MARNAIIVIFAQAAYLILCFLLIQTEVFRNSGSLAMSAIVATAFSVTYCTTTSLKLGQGKWMILPAISLGLLLVPAALVLISLYVQGFFSILA